MTWRFSARPYDNVHGAEVEYLLCVGYRRAFMLENDKIGVYRLAQSGELHVAACVRKYARRAFEDDIDPVTVRSARDYAVSLVIPVYYYSLR